MIGILIWCSRSQIKGLFDSKQKGQFPPSATDGGQNACLIKKIYHG